ncbi:carboxylesterase family protein, partial [Streptomyces sp. T-3]|nr:carboxylesterase family protein [Streptomyces sp. T-3]
AARFRPPAKPDSWDGIRDCTAASPAPPQGPDFLLEGVVGVEPVATDEAGSLTVNVWTPGRSGRRPVMVWIHGGGYIQGWGTQPWTDGARLAERHDVVVVSLNYRIGALGWLYVPELLGDDYADCANLGLQDQIAALTWVRDNIAHFGGDPESVTVFGESAGGGSAAMLLGTPAARPLLHRAILQSPPPRTVLSVERAAAIAREYAGILRERAGAEADADTDAGTDVRADADADVRTASPALLLAAQEELVARHGLDLPLAPVVDGTVLPLPPIQALRNGSCAHI